jgi:hypothetical protein
MNWRYRLLALLLMVALPPATLRAGETVERVVVVVNSRPILLSELEGALQREALLAAKPVATGEDERHAVLERMVDQELLREEMERSTFQHAAATEVDQNIQELRKTFPEAASDAGWTSVLARYGVSSEELRSAIAFERDTLRLIDLRLRPAAQPDQASIEEYYRGTYLPSVHHAGTKPQPLNGVRDTIKELLIQQKLAELTTGWLQSLRAQADIRWVVAKP